jgi:hypothetical protein
MKSRGNTLMTVSELIEQLKQLPHDYEVFYEGGDYKDDWQEVRNVSVSHRSTLGTPVGVYLK